MLAYSLPIVEIWLEYKALLRGPGSYGLRISI